MIEKTEKKDPIRFSSDAKTGELSEDSEALLAWWHELAMHQSDRADLKHCNSINQVALNPLYYNLRKKLGITRAHKMATATLAAVLAHVTDNAKAKFAVQMAKSINGTSTPVISDLRFRQIIATKDREDMEVEDWNELLNAMVRVVKQLNGRVNVIDLASSIYWWNNNTKQRLASYYYRNIPR